MTEKRLQQEYAELMKDWAQAEAARQQLADRLKTLDQPLALDDSMWEAWDEADEVAGHARESVRSFLAANGHGWQP